jgi:hypothetical protein
MKKIYKSKFQEIDFAPKEKLMIFKWKGGEESVKQKKFVKEVEEGIRYLEEFLPISLLIDTSKFYYLVTPEVQTKVSEFIIPKIDYVGIKRIAIILPEEEISELSIKQTVEEVSKPEGGDIEFEYFETKKEAIKWLSELEVSHSYSVKQFKEILKALNKM